MAGGVGEKEEREEGRERENTNRREGGLERENTNVNVYETS